MTSLLKMRVTLNAPVSARLFQAKCYLSVLNVAMTTNLRTPCLCAVFISGSPPGSISLSGMESDDCEVRCMISWVLLTALSSVIVSSWACCRHNMSKNELN